jgi:hypothetical protein
VRRAAARIASLSAQPATAYQFNKLTEIIKGIVQNVFLRLFCKCRTVMKFGQVLVEPRETLLSSQLYFSFCS